MTDSGNDDRGTDNGDWSDDLFEAAGSGRTQPREVPAPESPPSPVPDTTPAPYPEGPATTYSSDAQQQLPVGLEPQPRFGRRSPQYGPQPDADGYYPSDYYLGADWVRIVLGGLAAVAMAITLVGGGIYLFDRYDPIGDATVTADATPTPIPLVPVYQCAGDADPVSEMEAPAKSLIAGRTADSRWLAFRSPQPPPLQLWVRSSSVPDFDAFALGIVSCATSPSEFPAPLNVPTPLPTIGVSDTGAPADPTTDGTGQSDEVLPTPTALPEPTPVPTATPEPTATPTETPTPSPTPTATPDSGDG